MSCGVPTLYGDTSSMPEVVGDAGLAASPENVPQIMRRMEDLLAEEPLRRRLARRAVLRSLEFSWQRAAQETLDCYEHFIQRSRLAQSPRKTSVPGTVLPGDRAGISSQPGGRHAAA
jgi:glycosyltransferase involved in cell wall biosynthesis